MCSILSKLGGTVPLRALYLVCHEEILDIVYQCVEHLLKNNTVDRIETILGSQGKQRNEYAVSLLKTGAE